MSKKPIDWKLSAHTRGRTRGDLGIELEIEGTLYGMSENAKFWDAKGEGSLRQNPHGLEYVLRQPVFVKDLPEALKELGESLSRSKCFPSIRCSTHIHVNVLDKTIKEIYQILGYYFLIEDLLVQTQGYMRVGNLFCLRMSDAESIAHDLVESVQPFGRYRRNSGEPSYFKYFGMSSHKYGAVNLAAPAKFGSLEFRFFRPILDMALLEKWALLLYQMIEKASELPLKDTLRQASTLTAYEFLRLVFSKEQADMILEGVDSHNAKEMILGNYDLIENLREALEKKTKFYIPKEYLDTDIQNAQPATTSGSQLFVSTFGDTPNIDWVGLTTTNPPPPQAMPEVENVEIFLDDDDGEF